MIKKYFPLEKISILFIFKKQRYRKKTIREGAGAVYLKTCLYGGVTDILIEFSLVWWEL